MHRCCCCHCSFPPPPSPIGWTAPVPAKSLESKTIGLFLVPHFTHNLSPKPCSLYIPENLPYRLVSTYRDNVLIQASFFPYLDECGWPLKCLSSSSLGPSTQTTVSLPCGETPSSTYYSSACNISPQLPSLLSLPVSSHKDLWVGAKCSVCSCLWPLHKWLSPVSWFILCFLHLIQRASPEAPLVYELSSALCTPPRRPHRTILPLFTWYLLHPIMPLAKSRSGMVKKNSEVIPPGLNPGSWHFLALWL